MSEREIALKAVDEDWKKLLAEFLKEKKPKRTKEEYKRDFISFLDVSGRYHGGINK